MAETVIMPKLGFDMAEGTLVRWVISEGDEVEKGAVLAEIETDKATVEVESTYSGVLARQLVSEGSAVPVGDPIAIVAEPGEEVDLEQAPPKEEIARGGESEPGAFTAEELAKGEAAKGGEDAAAVGDVKRKPEAPPEEPVTMEEKAEAGREAQVAEGGELPGGTRASPVARRMAEEHTLDLSQIEGTGPGGRVVKKDVESYLERPEARRAAPEAPAPAEEKKPAPERKRAAVPLPSYAPGEPPPPDKEIPVPRLRQAIGRRMVESKQQAPHFYVTHEYDAGPLLKLRAQINETLGGSERISVNDFIVKAVALALRQFPNLNAALQDDKVVQYGQINIGVAVAIEGGLLTVVCRDADRKPLRQISQEVGAMVERVRSGKVKSDDIEGSTFSISNMGMFDVEHFIAIINPPEAAILAVGSALEVPVVENGEMKVGQRMKMTISIDHRVSDGAEGARFMQALAQYIEQPLTILL